MIPWEEIDRANIPGQKGELTLRRRGSEFSIRTHGTELMNSRLHGSEEALAELACNSIKKPGMKILIGGLGMGYTLAAAIKSSPPDARIVVSELIPDIVKWNKDHLGHLTGIPLDNSQVTIRIEDVAKTIANEKSAWDVILLDVDNGPEGLTQKTNDHLYSKPGLEKSFSALRSKGVLGIWSQSKNDSFTRRLVKVGFQAKAEIVRARRSGKNSKHTIWLAKKP
jgi:spermidine synthase